MIIMLLIVLVSRYALLMVVWCFVCFVLYLCLDWLVF